MPIEADPSKEGYSEIMEIIRSRALEFLQSDETTELESDRRDDVVNRIELLVLPGSGTFPNGRFEGALTDYFYFSYMKLVGCILQILDKKNSKKLRNVEFHLDLSHGINYMPSLIYRLVREIAALVATKYDVSFVTYNSEPYIGGDEKVLTVHIVENSKIEAAVPEVDFQDDGGLIRIIDFLKSARYGLPLLFTNVFPRKKTIEDLIQGIRAAFEEGIEIAVRNGRWELVRSVSLDERLRILAMAKVLVHHFAPLENHNDCNGVRWGDLKKFVDTVHLFTDTHKVLIMRELDVISSKVGELLKENGENLIEQWFSYSKAYGKALNDRIDIRNFLAHAGLEKNCLEIFLHQWDGKLGRKICLRYRNLDEVCTWWKVRNNSSSS